MKIKTFELNETTHLPNNLLNIFNSEDYCIIDIETTGLSRQYHQVILIGILYNQNNQIVIQQFFAEKPKEEILILKEFANLYQNFPCVITYNGAAFDIPFLKHRFKHHNLEWHFDDALHIDVLQCLRKDKLKSQLENLKLKTVERFLGIHRTDTISGQDSVLLYKEYVKNPSSSLEKTILLHNYEDIYYLNKLLHIFYHINIKKDNLAGNRIKVLYHSENVDFIFFPKDISVKKNLLFIKGITKGQINQLDIIHYGSEFKFEWTPSRGEFCIEIQLCEGYLPSGEKCTYIHRKDFNLSEGMPKEDQIHNGNFSKNHLMILGVDDKLNTDLMCPLISDILRVVLNEQ